MKMAYVSKDKTARGKMGKEDFKRIFGAIMKGLKKEEKKEIF